MNWESVKNDPYYQARKLEADARTEGKSGLWSEFAGLKAKKGSYALAEYAFLNAAILCEQEGKLEEAFKLYESAFDNACRAKSKEVALIVAYRHALLAESMHRWDECIRVYERFAALCEKEGNYFLAADACEHAAEIMVKSGKPVSEYKKPIEIWERNAEYWDQRGQEDDASWSRRHIALYKSLFGV